MKKCHMCMIFLFWILQFPAALLIGWPSLLYSLAQNVASDNPILVVCRTSIVTVIMMSVMKALLLQPLVKMLAKVHNAYTIADELSFNTQETKSLFFIQFLAFVVYPTFGTFLIDENCGNSQTCIHPMHVEQYFVQVIDDGQGGEEGARSHHQAFDRGYTDEASEPFALLIAMSGLRSRGDVKA